MECRYGYNQESGGQRAEVVRSPESKGRELPGSWLSSCSAFISRPPGGSSGLYEDHTPCPRQTEAPSCRSLCNFVTPGPAARTSGASVLPGGFLALSSMCPSLGTETRAWQPQNTGEDNSEVQRGHSHGSPWLWGPSGSPTMAQNSAFCPQEPLFPRGHTGVLVS